ncbi:MAG: tRNA (adenosine(37)-N6)-threonylcarbamoyltransferase complex transferase subunit TsaD [Chthonomonas sp.]|nr:tRNA (adenosine(37)-N6)-threonylcarbamoyltransferase complex transferase subunit TsaD [Chthonomonas sp.]
MISTYPGVVLGIESSCDETSLALLEGTRVRGLHIASQVDMHAKWGGVVPEAAARAHVEALLPGLAECLEQAKLSLAEVRAIAVTNRPGLIGALSVGVSAAKALSFGLAVPLIGIHHLEGHILSPYLTSPDFPFPHLCLIASGGHTELVRVNAPGKQTLLGQTLDDAAGEAFDKCARLLGLGYPGGRAVEECARQGDPRRYRLPRGVPNQPFNFSFSGLKTAVMRTVQTEGDRLNPADLAASLQAAVVDALVTKAVRACEQESLSALTLVGGVAANTPLRETLRREAERAGVVFATPEPIYCTDNAAMIALAGSVRLAGGEVSDFTLDVFPNADLP